MARDVVFESKNNQISLNVIAPQFSIAPAAKSGKAIKSNLEVVECWGTGKASREFIYVKDAAEGIILATKNYNSSEPLNLGSSDEISVKDITEKIAKTMGFKGKILWDLSKPEGQLRRCLDNSNAQKLLHFYPKINFDDGIKETLNWFYKNNGQ